MNALRLSLKDEIIRETNTIKIRANLEKIARFAKKVVHDDDSRDRRIRFESSLYRYNSYDKSRKIDDTQNAIHNSNNRDRDRERDRDRNERDRDDRDDSNNNRNRFDYISSNKIKMKCYNCDKKDHYENECRSAFAAQTAMIAQTNNQKKNLDLSM